VTETIKKRGRGRPPKVDLATLDPVEATEYVENQLDGLINNRSELVARSTSENGFEANHDAAVREFEERAREERRRSWASYHRRMHVLFSSLAAEHERKLQKLLRGPETLREAGE